MRKNNLNLLKNYKMNFFKVEWLWTKFKSIIEIINFRLKRKNIFIQIKNIMNK